MGNIILWILAGVGVVIIALILIAVVLEWFERTMSNRRHKRHMKAARSIASSLDSAAYWFCEDKATEQLLHDLADQIKRYGVVQTPMHAREEWRARRKL